MPTLVDAENVLNSMVGIQVARVEQSGEEVSRVHVLSDGSRPVKALVRDITGLFRHQYDVTLEPGAVSIVELNQDVSGDSDGARPRLAGVAWSREDGIVRVTCRLESDGHVHSQDAEDSDPGRAAARATLKAVEALVGGVLRLELVDYRVFSSSGGPVVVAVIRTSRGTTVSGSAMGSKDMVETAAKAALDGINRQILWWRHKGSA